jgi:hypothetical protein
MDANSTLPGPDPQHLQGQPAIAAMGRQSERQAKKKAKSSEASAPSPPAPSSSSQP